MRVLIDTNILLDWLMNREPFHQNATKIMENCLFGSLEGFLASHTLPDLFYILRRDFTVGKRKELLILLCDNMKVIPEDQETIKAALTNDNWLDLEDGLQMQCAVMEELDYIITRNLKDFETSKVKAISPEQFLALIQL